jgi:hypothetical protein
MTLITNIARALRNGKDDTVANERIASFIKSDNPDDILAWRLANYKELRRWSYPPPEDYLDAQVKLLSGDSTLVAKGQTELDTYVQQALATKTRFPKP